MNPVPWQVRAEDVEENLYAAIEKVSDMVTRKMRKVKEKAISIGKWEGSAGPRGHSVYKVTLSFSRIAAVHVIEMMPCCYSEPPSACQSTVHRLMKGLEQLAFGKTG